MFSGLKVDSSKGTSMSSWNAKNEPKCQRKYLRTVKNFEKSLVQRCYQSSLMYIFDQANRDI